MAASLVSSRRSGGCKWEKKDEMLRRSKGAKKKNRRERDRPRNHNKHGER